MHLYYATVGQDLSPEIINKIKDSIKPGDFSSTEAINKVKNYLLMSGNNSDNVPHYLNNPYLPSRYPEAKFIAEVLEKNGTLNRNDGTLLSDGLTKEERIWLRDFLKTWPWHNEGHFNVQHLINDLKHLR